MTSLVASRINISSSSRIFLRTYCHSQSFFQLSGSISRTKPENVDKYGSWHVRRTFTVYAPSSTQRRVSSAGEDHPRNAGSPGDCQNISRVSFYCDNPKYLLSEDFRLPIRNGPVLKESCIVVLLATAIHVSVIDDNSFVAEKLLPRLFGDHTPETVHLVTAIVDKIPYSIENEATPNNTDPAPRGQLVHGWDGLSLLVGNSSSEVDELLAKARQREDNKADFSQNRPSTISFQTKARYSPNSREEIIPDGQAIELRRKITLPLANTIFNNGRGSTLRAQYWAVEQNKPQLPAKFVLQSHKYLHQIDIPALTQTVALEDPVRLGRMQALTPFREVGSSMGNVLSTLRDHISGKEWIPASKELESCLPLALKTIPHDTYEVWAQIIPGSASMDQEQTPLWSSKSAHVGHGHRFHRVIGGGGCWGKRQGLVALDPDDGSSDHFDDHTQLGELGIPDMSLEQTAKPGDKVRFHLLAQESTWGFPPAGTNLLPRIQGDTSHRNVFGSMGLEGSSLDEGDISPRQTMDSPFWEVGLFGGLSHRCASLSMSLAAPEGITYKGVSPLGTVVQTKLPPNTLVYA